MNGSNVDNRVFQKNSCTADAQVRAERDSRGSATASEVQALDGCYAAASRLAPRPRLTQRTQGDLRAKKAPLDSFIHAQKNPSRTPAATLNAIQDVDYIE